MMEHILERELSKLKISKNLEIQESRNPRIQKFVNPEIQQTRDPTKYH